MPAEEGEARYRTAMAGIRRIREGQLPKGLRCWPDEMVPPLARRGRADEFEDLAPTTTREKKIRRTYLAEVAAGESPMPFPEWLRWHRSGGKRQLTAVPDFAAVNVVQSAYGGVPGPPAKRRRSSPSPTICDPALLSPCEAAPGVDVPEEPDVFGHGAWDTEELAGSLAVTVSLEGGIDAVSDSSCGTAVWSRPHQPRDVAGVKEMRWQPICLRHDFEAPVTCAVAPPEAVPESVLVEAQVLLEIEDMGHPVAWSCGWTRGRLARALGVAGSCAADISRAASAALEDHRFSERGARPPSHQQQGGHPANDAGPGGGSLGQASPRPGVFPSTARTTGEAVATSGSLWRSMGLKPAGPPPPLGSWADGQGSRGFTPAAGLPDSREAGEQAAAGTNARQPCSLLPAAALVLEGPARLPCPADLLLGLECPHRALLGALLPLRTAAASSAVLHLCRAPPPANSTSLRRTPFR